MNGDSSVEDDRAGEVPLPPAVTRWRSRLARNGSDGGMAPPFRVVPKHELRALIGPMRETRSLSLLLLPRPAALTTEAEPRAEPELIAPVVIEIPNLDTAASEPTTQLSVESTLDAELEITEAPVAELDVTALLELVEAIESAELADTSEPDPIEEVAAADHIHENANHLAQELADRLEKLTERLRAEDFDVLTQKLAQGDRLDVLLAGFLGGYAAVRKD